MAKDPTQGPVSTYDAEGKPITTNVDEPIEETPIEEAEEETAADESDVEEAEEVVADGPNETGEDIDFRVESAPEEVLRIEPVEDLWDRLTLTGADGGPEGEVRHVEFTCDRCGETKQGMLLPEGTAGFYATDEELGWSKYANEGEEIICDACMQSDERYLADYPAPEEAEVEETEDVAEEADEPEEEALDAEKPSETKEEITKERLTDEFGNPVGEDEYEEHSHDVKAPVTYNEAETLLKDLPFLKLRELAIADGLKPERSKVKVVQQLLNVWFAPSEAPKEEEPLEMSVRIRRIKGLM